MSIRTTPGHVLKRNLPQDHVRTNHPLAKVIVRRDAGNFKEGEEFFMALVQSLGQALEWRALKGRPCQIEQPVF